MINGTDADTDADDDLNIMLNHGYDDDAYHDHGYDDDDYQLLILQTPLKHVYMGGNLLTVQSMEMMSYF